VEQQPLGSFRFPTVTGGRAVRFGRMSRLLRASWRASHGWWLGYLNRLIGNRRTSQRGRGHPAIDFAGSAGAT